MTCEHGREPTPFLKVCPSCLREVMVKVAAEKAAEEAEYFNDENRSQVGK